MRTEIIDAVAANATLFQRRVWCRTCERSQVVADGLRDGWPKCCGYTMTIDPPESWASVRAKKISDALDEIDAAIERVRAQLSAIEASDKNDLLALGRAGQALAQCERASADVWAAVGNMHNDIVG